MSNAQTERPPESDDSRIEAFKKRMKKKKIMLHEATYEGYAPSDITVIVETVSDNIARTHHCLKSYFSKYGGDLVTSGVVSHKYSQLGIISYPRDLKKPDEMIGLVQQAGAEHCKLVENGYDIYCKIWDLETTRDKLKRVLGEPEETKTIWMPDSTTILDHERTKEVVTFLKDLEQQADVRRVFSNLEIPADYGVENI